MNMPDDETASMHGDEPPFWPPPSGWQPTVGLAAPPSQKLATATAGDIPRSQWQVIGRPLLVLLGILMLGAGGLAIFLGLGLVGFAGTGGWFVALWVGLAFLGLANVVGGAVLVARIYRTRAMPNTLLGGWPAAVGVSIGLFGLFGVLAPIGVIWWLSRPYP